MGHHRTKILIGCIIAFFYLPTIHAQNTPDSLISDHEKKHNWSISGYLKDLQSVQFTNINEKWTLDNLVHNRMDVHWYADSNWKFHLGIRNRLLYGESIALYQQNKSLLDGANNFFDLSKILASGESFLWHGTIDRASLDYTKGPWQITAGRQRINWGLNLVWNPNDIFNAYSYFDFDYEERPGTDALRVQYYTSSISSVEIAYKPGRQKDQTIAAGLYRFTKGNYDLQVMAGIMNTDYVLGGGFSGVLGKAGINGEVTVFIPNNSSFSSQTVLAASIGLNYTFPNSLYLHGAYLLNTYEANEANSLSSNLLLNNVTSKTLSPSRHSLFAEGAYQFSPLVRGDLSTILDPADGSFFIGPFITLSVSNTIDLLTGGQLFFGKTNSLYGNYGKILFLRLKWSF
jgi:hypothetical protein